MNKKWYIGTLFIIFSLFGAFQDQVNLPNQEIVLEFVDTSINKKNIESAITTVKKKLLKVGVSDIVIKETKNGTLKISYYSLTHINDIKEILLKENQLIVNKSSNHKEENNTSYSYKIDVYELTNEADINSKNDKFVFEIKYNSERFTTNYTYAFVKSVKTETANQRFKTAYKTHKNTPFTKDKTSHKEPEVRAGPCRSLC